MKQNSIVTLTITGVVALLFLLWYFDPKDRFKSEPILSRSDTTIINLPPLSISIPPSNSPTVIYQPIPANVDSLAVIRDYFAIRQYNDSLENDTVKIVLNEVIGQNKVVSRKLNYTLKLPISSVVNEYKSEQSRKLLLGGFASVDTVSTRIYLGAAYQNKQNQLFMAGYNPIAKSGMVGLLLPISLKRK